MNILLISLENTKKLLHGTHLKEKYMNAIKVLMLLLSLVSSFLQSTI